MRTIGILTFFILLVTILHAQWEPIGAPVSYAPFKLYVIDTSTIVSITGYNTVLESHQGESKWDTIINHQSPIGYSTSSSDYHFFFTNNIDTLWRWHRHNHIVDYFYHPEIYSNRIKHISDLGLFSFGPEKDKIFWSTDNGQSWDVVFTISDLPSLPANSQILRITNDVHGNLFMVCKSNWQTHLVTFYPNKKPVELYNNYSDFEFPSMSEDSSVYYISANGSRIKEYDKKFPSDYMVVFEGDSIYPDAIISDRNNEITVLYHNLLLKTKDAESAQILKDLGWTYMILPNDNFYWISNHSRCSSNVEFEVYDVKNNKTTARSKDFVKYPLNNKIIEFRDALLSYNCSGLYNRNSSHNWTTHDLGYAINSIRYCNGYHYLTTSDSIYYSTDGINWSPMKNINYGSNSYVINFNHNEIWIMTGRQLYKIKDPSNIELIEEDSYRFTAGIKISEDQYLVWGSIGEPLSDRRWMITNNGGYKFSNSSFPLKKPEVILHSPDDLTYFIYNDWDQLHLIPTAGISYIGDTISFDISVPYDSEYVILDANRFLINARDSILLIDIEKEKVTDVSIKEKLEYYKYGALCKTALGSIYVTNEADQIYRWTQTTTTKKTVIRQLTLSPNPFHDYSTIELNKTFEQANITVEAHDVSGQTIPIRTTRERGAITFRTAFKGLILLKVFADGQLVGYSKAISL